jgi:predicted RNase H-like HicB family nuclease
MQRNWTYFEAGAAENRGLILRTNIGHLNKKPSLLAANIAAYQVSGGCIMHTYTAVIERCPDTQLYVGYVPGFPGAHSQGETLDELNANLQEVIAMLLNDGEPKLDTEFVGTQTVIVA